MTRSQLHHKPLVTAALAVTVFAAPTGAALACQAVSAQSAASPRLTADTPSPCNAPRPEGFARCFAVIRTPASHKIVADRAGPPAGALGPADIQSAYKLPATGGGQTVAVVDAYGDSAAESDLASFRSHYGLPPCTTANGCFRKVNQDGKQGSYPRNDSGWGVETSLDLDAVSAACPRCNILLVEAGNPSIADLGVAAGEAVSLGARFVSNSYGISEARNELAFDHYYDHPGVAVTASTGDSGYGTQWPSTSQYVTAVGGTTLTKDAALPRGWNETVWGSAKGGEGTGSGCSKYEPQPADQNGVTTDCGNRAVADISADANPASGLAVYDTLGYDGWLQVGGTSLSSPLIAAAYALAGPPVSGTYPASYPYHDPAQSRDLFDITKGANGGCGTVLCRAGKGWDGPTGLGTPDGIKALASGPHGRIAGQVTSKASGKPLAGATVTANPGNYVIRTTASGRYQLSVAPGDYDVTAADYGYASGARTDVRIAGGQTATASFALAKQPTGTLSGTVIDGSGHGWPLPARIAISGYPRGYIWTSPSTGRYTVDLPQGSYTLSVTADYPGYRDRQLRVKVGTSTTEDVGLTVNTKACTAPGYGWDGLTQDFTGWTGGSGLDGWHVGNGGQGRPGWRFDNPGNRPPPPHGSIRPFPGWPRVFREFDSDNFAVADAGFYAPAALDTTLTSPAVSLAGQTAPEIGFDSAYYSAGNQQASVQLSTDGGSRWATVWQQSAGNALGPIAVPVPQAAGSTQVQIRFAFTGRGEGYWAVGNVLAGTPACVPRPGGLLIGAVTGRAKPIDGAQVASAADPTPQPWPAGISLTSADPSLPGGFYWLFAPAGDQRVTATAGGYLAASAQVNVAANRVTSHDWTLTPAEGS